MDIPSPGSLLISYRPGSRHPVLFRPVNRGSRTRLLPVSALNRCVPKAFSTTMSGRIPPLAATTSRGVAHAISPVLRKYTGLNEINDLAPRLRECYETLHDDSGDSNGVLAGHKHPDRPSPDIALKT